MVPGTISRIAVTLYVRNLIFNYATLYSQKHDSIAGARNFALTDNEYAEFVAYLQDKFFDYQTETEQTFAKLKQQAEKDESIGDASAEFDALYAKLSHDRFKDLEIHRADVKELLSEEIVARYYYNAGKIANSLRYDSQITASVETLRETDKYKTLLGYEW